ncbi:MAG: hypothetical protein ACR2FS_12770 [Phormidesmis sp.]
MAARPVRVTEFSAQSTIFYHEFWGELAIAVRKRKRIVLGKCLTRGHNQTLTPVNARYPPTGDLEWPQLNGSFGRLPILLGDASGTSWNMPEFCDRNFWDSPAHGTIEAARG